MGFMLVFVLCFFRGGAAAAEWACNCDPRLCKAYSEAVMDAARPLTMDRISPALTAIIPENENLIWEDDVAGSRVLVVIYSWGLNPSPGQLPNPNYSLKTNKWVTVAPELYNFFSGRVFTHARLEQLLGLPPCYGNTKIIELFISPSDMFRPSPDPETTDRTASLEFPWRTSKIVTYDASRTIYDDFCGYSPCYSDYETWFTNRRSGVYTASPPYPWTGLGYTYDWNHSSSRIGLSEFVVTPTTVGVLRISDATDYFLPHKHTLTVYKTGFGKVESISNGINCGSHCSGPFSRYAKIRLTAVAASSAQFERWEGACAYAGSNPVCTVTMVNDKSVTAVFISNSQGPAGTERGDLPQSGHSSSVVVVSGAEIYSSGAISCRNPKTKTGSLTDQECEESQSSEALQTEFFDYTAAGYAAPVE